MRRRRRALGVAVVLACATLGVGSAAAQGGDPGAEQVADLADRAAAGDRAALAELQGVTSIDGQPSLIVETLVGADGVELRGRLQELGRSLRAESSAAGGAGSESAEQARADAERIVAGFDLEADSAPASADLDAAPAPPGSGGGLSLGGPWLWVPLLFLALLAGVALAVRLARNREAAGRLEREGEPAEDADASAADIERAALAAERSGDFAAAVRLRFGLAVEALAGRGVISLRPSLTPSEVAATLADRRAGSLVSTFERVVYGRFDASSEDAAEAREGWQAVISGRAGE